MAVLSDITNDNTCNITQTIRNDTSNDNVKLVGGWRKGSTKAARKKKEQQVSDVVSQCALKFQEQVEKAKKAGKVVPHGTLKDIIKEEEEKNGLEVNSISFETVRSRVKRGNILGYNPQQLSPMHDIEPLIFEFCVRLAKMGKPLTKTTVIELANSLVSGITI
jgi:phosphate starvation-inducible protein PhoH